MWTEITNTALMGCERKSLSLDFPSGKLGGLLTQLDPNDREGALLGATAIVSLYERAGTLPLKDAQPAPEACAPDEAPRCSERAAIRLAMMLRGEHRRLLPEWLAKTAAAGHRAPEELLPSLLELGRAHEEAPDAILPALGARGRWLAAQNPDWFYAVEKLDESLWETGSGAQRRAVLAELRKRDAARARELLASSWERESPKDRADFLTALENGLSLDDEAFLEAALDDRRKEVRGAAADLLARLPESSLRRRMFERVRPLITFKLNRLRRKTIEIALPEACDKEMQRDGVEPKPYSRDIGEKAWLLQQMFGMIPPEVWSNASGWSITELIEAAKRSEWKNVLLNGWSQAARLCRDVEWAAALLAEAHDQEQDGHLFQVLPQALQEAFILELLRKNPSLHTSNPARNYVAICWRQWGEALSRRVIDSLLHHAETDRFKDGWMWSGFMDNIGCRIYPGLISEAISRLTEVTKPPAEREPALERFLDFIQFRHEMLKEINQ
ncbi:MAG: hypothetical protein J2P21_17080 [Chloracidobacterium sp.]|nr:hypothetical protein [Chloracidobacterium sp.]